MQYQAKVTGTPDYKGKPTITCLAPWGGDYPLTIYLKKEQSHLTDTIKKGDIILVQRGSLKDGKDADKPYNYFYDLVLDEIGAPAKVTGDQQQRPPGPGAGVRDMPPVAPKPAQGQQTLQEQNAPRPEPTRAPVDDVKQFRSAAEMTRRDALEFAVGTWGVGAPEQQILDTAEVFERWLLTRERPAPQELPF